MTCPGNSLLKNRLNVSESSDAKGKKIFTQAYFILQMNKAHLTQSKTMSVPMVHLCLNPEIVNMHFSLAM